ncbi:hypothetical protein FRC14_003719 [Serendipita sp. 396]|nr:hypothetical protein FRC14_003719 [Serendipita sp. 396]
MVGNSTATPLDHPARAAQAASAKLLDLAKQITLGRYFAGVAFTLALYDWIILLEQESRYVWNTRWRLTKGIYYYNRVMSLIGLGITVLETTDQWTNELPISLQDVFPARRSHRMVWFLWGKWCVSVNTTPFYTYNKH